VVNERAGRITNEDIYSLCQQILATVKDYGERTVNLLNQINTKLDTIYEGIKTLSDNQVCLQEDHFKILEKLESLRSLTDEIRGIVRELRAVLPGV